MLRSDFEVPSPNALLAVPAGSDAPMRDARVGVPSRSEVENALADKVSWSFAMLLLRALSAWTA